MGKRNHAALRQQRASITEAEFLAYEEELEGEYEEYLEQRGNDYDYEDDRCPNHCPDDFCEECCPQLFYVPPSLRGHSCIFCGSEHGLFVIEAKIVEFDTNGEQFKFPVWTCGKCKEERYP